MSQTVLVADDSQTIRKVVQMALKASQFEVVGVGSAREAVEAAQQQPTVILLDYYMPDGSGYDVCRALKNNSATSGIPVIMLGGTYKNFDAQMARDSGASLVVMKPFKTDELVGAIEAAVNGAGAAPSPPAQPVQAQPVQAPPAQPPPQAVRPSQPVAPTQPPVTQPPMTRSTQETASNPAAPSSLQSGSGARNVPNSPTQTPVPESQPRIPLNAASQSRAPSPTGSQPQIPTRDSKPDPRPRQPMPASGSGASAMPGAMSRDEIQEFIVEEVKSAVRAELPALLRNVMGEVFQQKVLPKLLQHSDQKIQDSLNEQLSRRITEQVRQELERLLSEE